MDNTFFSIIIPVYNCAPFLNECIDSILGQNYRNFEVIMIDDGSTDGSAQIAKSAAEEHPQFRCISANHVGAGAARNIGMEQAKGDYLLFLDADDYWRDRELLKSMDYEIRHYNVDVVMFQMIQVSQDGVLLLKTRKPPFPSGSGAFRLREVYPFLVRDGQVLASACTKCVRRSLVEEYKIKFMEGTTCEDIDWVLQLFSHVKTISFLNEEAYAYRQHRKGKRASEAEEGPYNLARVIRHWADLIKRNKVPNGKAVAGMVAFEYGVFMGYSHQVSGEERKRMKQYRYLLKYGLDRKTRMIAKFYNVFGYTVTCMAVRLYLLGRKFRR